MLGPSGLRSYTWTRLFVALAKTISGFVRCTLDTLLKPLYKRCMDEVEYTTLEDIIEAFEEDYQTIKSAYSSGQDELEAAFKLYRLMQVVRVELDTLFNWSAMSMAERVALIRELKIPQEGLDYAG